MRFAIGAIKHGCGGKSKGFELMNRRERRAREEFILTTDGHDSTRIGELRVEDGKESEAVGGEILRCRGDASHLAFRPKRGLID